MLFIPTYTLLLNKYIAESRWPHLYYRRVAKNSVGLFIRPLQKLRVLKISVFSYNRLPSVGDTEKTLSFYIFLSIYCC